MYYFSDYIHLERERESDPSINIVQINVLTGIKIAPLIRFGLAHAYSL